MTIWKRLGSLLLAAVMVLSMLPVQALATEAAEAPAVSEAAPVETQTPEAEPTVPEDAPAVEASGTEPTETQTPEADPATQETSGTVPTEQAVCQHASVAWSANSFGHRGYCSECSTYLNPGHVWDESRERCTVCGYQNHAHSIETYDQDAGHLADGTPVEHGGFCSGCNMYVSENHSWGADKVCTVCGLANSASTGNNWAIIYVLDGGVNAEYNPATYTEGEGCVLGAPTREGYSFEGWFTDAAFTTPIMEISPEQTGDITLYAKWSSNAHRLAAPTDLEWGFMRLPGHLVPKDTALPGCISWKTRDSLQSGAEIVVYKEGQSEPYYTTYVRFSSVEGEWWSIESFINRGMESGTYYFTVTAKGDGVDTLDSETVSSDTWTYTKPTEKLPTVTELSLTGSNISWTPLEVTDSVWGYTAEVFYRADQAGTPSSVGMTSINSQDCWGFSIYQKMQATGSGYYSVRVKVISMDATQIESSDWTGMSQEAYYEVVEIPTIDSVELLREYAQREYTDYVDLNYCGPEPLVISEDLTIQSGYCRVTVSDIEIAAGCTLTNNGLLRSDSTVTANGDIVNNGTLYLHNNAGSGLVVSSSGSYSGYGIIGVYNTEITDPWDRIHGLNSGEYTTVKMQDSYWQIRYVPAVTYGIDYMLNGGTNSPENPDSYVEGVGCALADPTREEYTFEGWYTEETFANRVTDISTEQTGDVTLYARWRSIHRLDPESARIWEDRHSGVCSHCGQYIDGEHDWDYGASVGRYCMVCGYRDHEHTIIGYKMDEYEHAPICEICGPYHYETHTGMEDAICDVCGYREHVHHSDTLVSDGYQHKGVCAECGCDMTGFHTWNEDGSACTVCGYSHAHQMRWSIDEAGHDSYCKGCSYRTEWAEHTMEDRDGVNTCAVCGYMEHDHHCDSMDKYEDYHSGECDECGSFMYGSHEYVEGSDPRTCAVCGYMEHAHAGGAWNPVYYWNEETQDSESETHKSTCTVCGGNVEEAHNFDDLFICTVCGYHDHTKSAPVITNWWGDNDKEHGGSCTLCGRYYSEAHQWNADGTACTICGYEKHTHVWSFACSSILEGTHMRNCVYRGQNGSSCHATISEPHTFETVDGVRTCTVCGYMEHAHETTDWEMQAWGHTRVCMDCGFREYGNHQMAANGDGVKACVVCGYLDHQHTVPESKWDKTESEHFGACAICGSNVSNLHTMQVIGGIPTCVVCGYQEHTHTPTYDWKHFAQYADHHSNSCAACGATYEEEHSWKTVGGVPTCTVCGYMDHKHTIKSWDRAESAHSAQCTACSGFVMEPHTYNGGNTCTICGYKQHQHKMGRDWTIVESSHGRFCKICNMSAWSRHSMKTVDGVSTCVICGYKDHIHDISGWVSTGNPYEHSGICTDCGATIYQDHTLSSKGVCTVCGYSDKPAKTSAVTYVLNGGTNNPNNPSAYTEGLGCLLLEPAKEGYAFEGWFTDKACTKQIAAISPEQTGKVTLYAKWTKLAGVTYTWSGDVPPDGGTYCDKDGAEVSGVTLPLDETQYKVGEDVTVNSAYAAPYSLTDRNSGDMYAFSGWYIDANGNGQLDATDKPAGETAAMPNNGLKLVGRWDAAYHVTYSWSGDVPPEEVGALPTDLTGYPAGENVTVDSVYAQKLSNGTWDPIVKWVADDDSDRDVSCAYAFYGWYVDTNGNGQLDETDRRANPREAMPEGGLTLVGLWRKALTAKYSWEDGTLAGIVSNPDSYPLPMGGTTYSFILESAWSKKSIPVENYKGQADYADETGSYIFAGWFDSEGKRYTPGESQTTDLTLYGRWIREEKYAVTYTWSGSVPPEEGAYKTNGPIFNKLSLPADECLYKPGDALTLAEPHPGFAEGYILYDASSGILWYFAGWYVDADNNGQVDENDPYVGPTAVMEEGGLHLVGKWSRGYWITAAWDEGTPEGIKDNDVDYPLPYFYASPCPEGATFWPAYSGLMSYTDDDGKVFYFDGIYLDGEKIGSEAVMPSGDVELKLRWTAAEDQEIRHAITYVLNGGSNAPDAPTYYVEGQTCPLVDPVRRGDTFVGWYVNTAEFKGEPITEIPDTMTGEVTLYAKWEAVTCEVTYELNGSDAAPVYNDPANPAVLTIDSKSVKLKKPTRAGYTFDGWFANGEPVTAIAFDGREALTVEAWWTPISYKITYKNVAKDEFNPNPSTFTVEGLALEPMERLGFDFGGWFTDSKCTKPLTDGIICGGTTKNMTLYAKWTVHTYTVHFDRNAPADAQITGKDMKDLTVACGKTVKLTACAFKDSSKQYLFAGWNTDPEGSGIGFLNKEAIEDLLLEDGGEITLYAQWVENDSSYTISFNANCYDYEGEDPDAVTGNYVKAVKLPRNPYTRRGYTFTGWNTAPDGSGVAYKNSASVKAICADDSEEVTLYAQWKPITYKISYSLNGGGKVPTNPATYTMDTLADGPIYLDAPVKKGYTFLGWSSSSKGAPNVEWIEDIPSGKTTTWKLYAQWRPNEYTILLAGNGSGVNDEQKASYGKAVKLKNAMSRDGYVFLGWNTMPDGSGKTYKNKASVKNLTLEDGETVALYAQWASASYNICFAANGGSGKMDPMSGVKYGKAQKLAANTLRPRDGYIFLGWNTMPDGSGISYKDKASVRNLAQSDSDTATLYAQWVKDAYTVVFDANGGEDENGKRISSQSDLPYKKSAKLNGNPFKRGGYTFLGWNTKADGTGKTYKNKASVKSLCATGDGVVTLYAQWKPVAYKITYSLGGGKNPAGAPKTFYVTSGAVTLPTPTKKGYQFDGWRDGQTGETVMQIDAAATPRTFKLTAKWIQDP